MGHLFEVLPKVLTDRISVGMDDLMPHFFPAARFGEPTFPFHKNISDFFTAFNLACRLGDVRVGT